MKKINGHSISHKLILYMIEELGGIEAVVKAHKATLPVEPPDPIADMLFDAIKTNKGTACSVDALLELFPDLNQQSVFTACQRLIRAKKIKYACASYQNHVYWIPGTDDYFARCRDCSYLVNPKDAPWDCSEHHGGYIAYAAEKVGHYCHCFLPFTKAKLVKQENEVLEVIKRTTRTPYDEEYDEHDNLITEVPVDKSWDSCMIAYELEIDEPTVIADILARLHAKGKIKKVGRYSDGWEIEPQVTNKQLKGENA